MRLLWKKSKILCLVICVLSLISIIGFAAENTYYYYKDGEKKYFTVRVTIDGQKINHQIVGTNNSYPSGYGKVYYIDSGGIEDIHRVYGTSTASYWQASNKAPAYPYRASTTVTTIITRTVTAIK